MTKGIAGEGRSGVVEEVGWGVALVAAVPRIAAPVIAMVAYSSAEWASPLTVALWCARVTDILLLKTRRAPVRACSILWNIRWGGSEVSAEEVGREGRVYKGQSTVTTQLSEKGQKLYAARGAVRRRRSGGPKEHLLDALGCHMRTCKCPDVCRALPLGSTKTIPPIPRRSPAQLPHGRGGWPCCNPQRAAEPAESSRRETAGATDGLACCDSSHPTPCSVDKNPLIALGHSHRTAGLLGVLAHTAINENTDRNIVDTE